MEQNDQRNSAADIGDAPPGAHKQANLQSARDQRADVGILDSTTQKGGVRGAEEQAEGTTKVESGSLEWGFTGIWNSSLEEATQRPLEKRDHLWAGELYSAPVDVWLKMRAEPYTNPPNARSLRKFEAGHLMEWIVSMILRRAGILRGEEIRAEHQYQGLLKVTGRMDKLGGGKPDYEAAKRELAVLELPEGFQRAAEKIITTLAMKYPNGLGDKPIEIKSVSSFGMDSMEKKGISIKRHRVQLYHYLKSSGYTHGLLVYICRDDMRMAEFQVLLDSPVEAEYRERIELLTKFHGETARPGNDPLLIWEEDFGKFSKNLNVEYSPYLQKLYGFETPRDYSEIWGKKASNWNRVLKRVKEGAKMTPLNETVLEEMRTEGYDPIALSAKMPDDPPEEEVGV